MILCGGSVDRKETVSFLVRAISTMDISLVKLYRGVQLDKLYGDAYVCVLVIYTAMNMLRKKL